MPLCSAPWPEMECVAQGVNSQERIGRAQFPSPSWGGGGGGVKHRQFDTKFDHRLLANHSQQRYLACMRLALKTGSYSLMHLTVAIAVTYTITRDWRAALAVGLIEPAVQTVAFLIHDRIWSRIDAKKSA